MSELRRRVRDGFPESLLARTAESGISHATVDRHLPVMRSCIGLHDPALMVARCDGTRATTGRRIGGATRFNILLLTRHRLVVTSESRVLRRMRLYLNANLIHLADVTWTPEPDKNAVQLDVTAMDGDREHFWIKVKSGAEVRRLDGLLRESFDRRLACV